MGVSGGRLGNSGGHIQSGRGCSSNQVGGILQLVDSAGGRGNGRGRYGRREGGKVSRGCTLLTSSRCGLYNEKVVIFTFLNPYATCKLWTPLG